MGSPQFRLAAAAAVLALGLTAGCGSHGNGSASSAPGGQALASSLAANPTVSSDVTQVKKIFAPCLDVTASHPVIRAVSCAKSKVPAVADKKTRRKILGALGSCLVSAYNKAGSWAAFKAGSGWPACAQAAYNAALAAGGRPSASTAPAATPAVTGGSSS